MGHTGACNEGIKLRRRDLDESKSGTSESMGAACATASSQRKGKCISSAVGGMTSACVLVAWGTASWGRSCERQGDQCVC